jgi:Tfp pilus assembly protein PilF
MHSPSARGLPGPIACGLAALVIVAYLPALGCDFIYDDYLVIHSRSVPTGWSEWISIFTTRQADNLPYYRPLTWLTIDVQTAWHGHWAMAFHAVNVLLAACFVASVFWLLLARCLRLSWPLAALGALAAALHPVAACTVYPVSSGRETLLAAVAITLAVAAWLRSDGPGGRRFVVLAWGSVAVGLLCREQAVVVPLLLVLADLLGLPGSRPDSARAWIRRHAPMGLLLAGYLAIRWSLFAGTGEHRLAVLDHPLGPLQSVGYTLQTLLAPGWSLVYEPDLSMWWHPLRGPAALLLLCLIGCGVWWRCSSSQVGLGRVVVFWLGWFVLVLAPTSNLVGQQTVLAERYGFLATVPLVGLVLLGLAGGEVQARVPRRGLVGVVAVRVVAVGVVCGLALVGWSRGTAYRSHDGFLRQWVAAVPTSAQAHLSLAGVLLEDGDDPGAELHLDRALELEPEYSEAHDGKGRILFHRGELAAAEASFRRAVFAMPSFAEAWNHLGFVVARQGRLDAAAESCGHALELDPQLAEAHNNLGMIRAEQGRIQVAAGHFEAAVGLLPGYAEAWTNLGLAYLDLDRPQKAADAWRQALAIDPDSRAAKLNLGRLERDAPGGSGR